MSELREECGVVGVFSPRETYEIGRTVYYGLYSLQHRGQESCGIVVNDIAVMCDSHASLDVIYNYRLSICTLILARSSVAHMTDSKASNA